MGVLSRTVIVPGVELEEGVAVDALSQVDGACGAFGIYAGVPAVRKKQRRLDLLQAEAAMRLRQTKE